MLYKLCDYLEVDKERRTADRCGRQTRTNGASAYRHTGARNMSSKRHALFRDTSLTDTVLPLLILLITADLPGLLP
jgi:hypothetical protein